jgi:molybdopterin-guanine dinucleotide biosynthesis protein A
MGRPKATLVHGGQRLIDRAIELAHPFVDAIFLVGRMPDGVALESARAACHLHVMHLLDDPTASGPLAGILAALAHDPQADWLCLSCDMPGLTREAIDWLMNEHEPPRTAAVGRPLDGESSEPFPAIYRAAALPLLRAYAQSGGASLRGALTAINADVRPVPTHLAPCWINVNTPADWERFLGS